MKPLLLLCLILPLAGCASLNRLGPDEREQAAGRVYVVTGASSGFGRGVALRLAGLGARVAVAARRREGLQSVAAEMRRAGGEVLVVPTDVAHADQMQHLAQATLQRFGRIDVWVNNAGVGAIGRFEEIPLEDHARLVDVNLKGVIYGSHIALRQFRAQGQGTLVNIGSVESEVPLAYQASYAASKAAVLSLGRALNEEIRLSGQHGISVATVLPWVAATPFFSHTANYSGRAPSMIAPDDPWQVVEAIVWVSLHPREELPVGWKAWGAYAAHRVFPDLSERIAADVEHRAQMVSGPPAPSTSGNLHRPLTQAWTVEGNAQPGTAPDAGRKAAE